MRTVWLIPVAYVAGIEGFGWFVPYLLFVCAVATFARLRKRQSQGEPAAEPLRVFGSLELETATA